MIGIIIVTLIIMLRIILMIVVITVMTITAMVATVIMILSAYEWCLKVCNTIPLVEVTFIVPSAQARKLIYKFVTATSLQVSSKQKWRLMVLALIIEE